MEYAGIFLVASFSLRRGHRVRDARRPGQPMDMVQEDSWSAGIRQRESYSFGRLDSRIAFNSIYHLMDNFRCGL